MTTCEYCGSTYAPLDTGMRMLANTADWEFVCYTPEKPDSSVFCHRPEACRNTLRILLDMAKADAAALRNVLEDCHAHDLYVSEGAEASRLYVRSHGSDWGRVKDESAYDHEVSMRAAISGELGGQMLDEIRNLRKKLAALISDDPGNDGDGR